jgi:hypothetical protein
MGRPLLLSCQRRILRQDGRARQTAWAGQGGHIAPIANQVCRYCGQPAVEGWVDLDGSVIYCCEQHVETNATPPKRHAAEAPPAKDARKA